MGVLQPPAPLRQALPQPALPQAHQPVLRPAQLPLLKNLAPPHRPPPHLLLHLEPPCSIHMLTITTSNAKKQPPLRRPPPPLLKRISKLPVTRFQITILLTCTVTLPRM